MKKLGKYEIRRELGKGAMGVVYEAFDPMIERTVALKTILPQYLASPESVDILARFKREAQAAGRLNHPGIVAVYDYGEDVGLDETGQPSGGRVAFIAMEFVKGRELRDFFDSEQRFALPDILRLMGEVLEALAHAHANGVVHRDLKPANLMVLDSGKIKIADFGIARVEKSELTQVGTVMGTPSYMSPEQIMGQPVDGRSDLFSCGVILYQFLTGERPFTGNATTIMYKVLNEVPLPPSMLNVSLPPTFDAVVKKAMAKSPDERFQSAREFFQALAGAMQAQDQESTVSRPAMQDDATIVARPAAASPAVDPLPTIRVAPDDSFNAAPAANPHANTPTQPPARPAAPPAATPASLRTHTPTLPPESAAATAAHSGSPRQRTALWVALAAVGMLAVGGGGYFLVSKSADPSNSTASASASATPPQVASVPANNGNPVPAQVSNPVANDPPEQAGQIIVSSLGLADPKDPKYNGSASAAQDEARLDAKRQLVEKVLALYLENASLNQNYPLLEQKMLSNYGSFIKNVIYEGAPVSDKNGLVSSEARAVLNVREVRRSLNELSKQERIDFIRNHGSPKIAIQMNIANAENPQALAPARSQLAENVVKERIKSFGFQVWANEGDTSLKSTAKGADFQVLGEAKVKQLSAKLAASGLTITKTVLTSWTVKAIDKASGEEIYLNTVLPKGQSWASEDQALADIGKLMGDEFSKNFFLQYYEFAAQKTNLTIQGLPDAQSARLVLHQLQGIREIVDSQMLSESGRYQLQLPEGSHSELLQKAFIKPLNAKLGQDCFALAGSSQSEINISFAPACKDKSIQSKLESAPPAGLNQTTPRGKQLLQKFSA
ncbi:MAG: hypothetical protein RL748_2855 [Pseudomonadota bacterium]|jgi:serine/threonine-protein kinase